MASPIICSSMNDGRSHLSFLLALVANCFEFVLHVCSQGSAIDMDRVHMWNLGSSISRSPLSMTLFRGHACPKLHLLVTQAKNVARFLLEFQLPHAMQRLQLRPKPQKQETHPILAPFSKFLLSSNICLLLFIMQNLKVVVFDIVPVLIVNCGRAGLLAHSTTPQMKPAPFYL